MGAMFELIISAFEVCANAPHRVLGSVRQVISFWYSVFL
jgi:hypothetical protein